MARVFLILKDPHHRLARPLPLVLRSRDTAGVQIFCYFYKAVSCQIIIVDHPHRLSLLGDDLWISIRPFSVSYHTAIWKWKFPLSVPHPFSPGNVLADRLTFRLCKSTQHREDHLGCHRPRINILFFKNHRKVSLAWAGPPCKGWRQCLEPGRACHAMYETDKMLPGSLGIALGANQQALWVRSHWYTPVGVGRSVWNSSTSDGKTCSEWTKYSWNTFLSQTTVSVWWNRTLLWQRPLERLYFCLSDLIKLILKGYRFMGFCVSPMTNQIQPPNYASMHEWDSYQAQLTIEYEQSFGEGKDVKTLLS